jgi:hypothetical protein
LLSAQNGPRASTLGIPSDVYVPAIVFLPLIASNTLSCHAAHKPTEGLVSSYSQGAAKEAGKETVKYVAENPMTQQQLSDAEAKAQQGYEDAKQQAQVCLSGMAYNQNKTHHLYRACGRSIVDVWDQWRNRFEDG